MAKPKLKIIMCRDGIMDDGGIVINSAVRQFMREKTDYDLEILGRLFHFLMPYINQRTLCVAIRDLQPGSIDDYSAIWDHIKDPISDVGRNYLRHLTNYLMDVYLFREDEEHHFDLDHPTMSANQILRVGQEMECIKSYMNRGLFENHADFMAWAEHELNMRSVIVNQENWNYREVKDQSFIPLASDEMVPVFQELTVLAAKYAVNRQTYVPDSVTQFILDNYEIFNSLLLRQIWDIVKDDQYNSCWEKIKIWKD